MANQYHPRDIPPGYLVKWQSRLDRIAAAYKVPAALVIRIWPEQLEVLLSSLSDGNPHEEHERADLGTGLYCETVIATRQQLAVPNALEDPEWSHSPEIKRNMISYLGVPLIWPDDSIFGTLCVLDSSPRHYPSAYQHALWKFKELIERDFAVFCRTGMEKSESQTAEDWDDEFLRVIDGLNP